MQRAIDLARETGNAYWTCHTVSRLICHACFVLGHGPPSTQHSGLPSGLSHLVAMPPRRAELFAEADAAYAACKAKLPPLYLYQLKAMRGQMCWLQGVVQEHMDRGMATHWHRDTLQRAPPTTFQSVASVRTPAGACAACGKPASAVELKACSACKTVRGCLSLELALAS